MKPTPPPESGKIAGIDFGTVRIGVAICDSERMIAFPHEIWRRRNEKLDLQHFQDLVKQEQIVHFVVGLPLHCNGAYPHDALNDPPSTPPGHPSLSAPIAKGRLARGIGVNPALAKARTAVDGFRVEPDGTVGAQTVHAAGMVTRRAHVTATPSRIANVGAARRRVRGKNGVDAKDAGTTVGVKVSGAIVKKIGRVVNVAIVDVGHCDATVRRTALRNNAAVDRLRLVFVGATGTRGHPIPELRPWNSLVRHRSTSSQPLKLCASSPSAMTASQRAFCSMNG